MRSGDLVLRARRVWRRRQQRPMRGSNERGRCTPNSRQERPDVPARTTTLFDRSPALSPRGSSVPASREPEGETIPALEARLTEADLHLAVKAERAAREVQKRLERARELDERFPHGRPRRPSEDDQLERRIDSALTAWASGRDAQVPPGQTVDELEEDLASVDAQLEGAGASARRQEGDVRGGLFARLLRAIRTFFAAFLRLFGVGRHEPSVQPERRQALEESRAHIRELIAAREHADRRLEEDTQRARGAADNVQEAALAVGLTASDPDAAAASLLAWQKRRDDRLTESDEQMKDWVELQQLLGEGTLDELAEKATTARDEAMSAGGPHGR